MITFNPFPIIDITNVILRRMEYKDINDIFEMRKDPRMHEHTDTKWDENIEETKAYIEKMNKGVEENKWIIWAIEHKQSQKVIGVVSIWNINIEKGSGELGYGIIPDYQGKGLMREVLLGVADYGFDVMHLRVLDAYTEEDNVKSNKLLEGCGFTMVGRVDDPGYYSKRVYHMIIYRLQNIY